MVPRVYTTILDGHHLEVSGVRHAFSLSTWQYPLFANVFSIQYVCQASKDQRTSHEGASQERNEAPYSDTFQTFGVSADLTCLIAACLVGWGQVLPRLSFAKNRQGQEKLILSRTSWKTLHISTLPDSNGQLLYLSSCHILRSFNPVVLIDLDNYILS